MGWAAGRARVTYPFGLIVEHDEVPSHDVKAAKVFAGALCVEDVLVDHVCLWSVGGERRR